MKTSIKLLLSALLVVVVALFAYDKMVQTEYRSNAYKNPYRYYTDLKFKDFDTINVKSVSASNVLFEQGPFRVRISPGADEFTRISQNKRILDIEAVFKYGYQNNLNSYVVIITCPKIASLKTSAWYGTNGKFYIDTIVKDQWNMRKVLVEGFKQDSLVIAQDYGSRVFLSNNNIGYLKATIGLSNSSGSQLNILNNNHFENVDLEADNKSTLLINSMPKNKSILKIADSAQLILTGSARNILKK
ncbi:MAG: hypothetical protein ACXVB0_19025 [Mucilaginibacter sp.]